VSITIRQGKPGDAGAISGLLMSLLSFVVDDPTAPEASQFIQSFSEEEVMKRLMAHNYVYYIAEDSQGISGFIALRDNKHLYHLFVRPDSHGQGIGRSLWHHLLAESNWSTCTVNSAPCAVPIYRSFGFKESGEPKLNMVPAHVPMKFSRGS
jgi:predicted N-acetyltransferase YhbS